MMAKRREMLIGVGIVVFTMLAAFTQSYDALAQSTPVGSTLSNPHPYGAVFAAGVFDMQITSIDLDAWPEIQAENQFNDPPTEGHRYVMWTLTVENVRGSPDESEIADYRDFSAIVSGVVYEARYGDHWCGIFPNEFDHQIFLGGRVEANICVSVPKDDFNITLLYESDHTDANGDSLEVEMWFKGLGELGQPDLPTYHPCDTNQNGKIDREEVLEVIALYLFG